MLNGNKILLSGFVILFGVLVAVSAVFALGGPSVFCHETDGGFTDCDPAVPGPEEWSDILSTTFAPGTVLYADQADKHPTRSIPNGSGIDTLMLMYDEVQRTVPLLPDESVHVHFMTVDGGQIVHYDVFIGNSGIKKVLIDDVEQIPMPSGLSGMAGFGPSPNSLISHVMAELQIGLEAAGFTSEECCYSPDPAWWGSAVPPNPTTPEGEPCVPRQGVVINDPIGDPKPCIPGKPETTTSAIFTANLDGTTTIVPTPLRPHGDEPPQAACVETVNPHGKTVPPAGSTTLPGTKGGQNEDGFYVLLASQDKDLPGSPEIWVEDAGSGVLFGPFKNGDRMKYTEANGAIPGSKKIGSTATGNAGQSDAITAHITGTGDAAVFAVAAGGEAAAKVLCNVPPPPK